MMLQSIEARIAFELDGIGSFGSVILQPAEADSVMGGQARIHSLSKRADLNGQVGRVLSFNANGKRRFGLRVTETSEVLSIKPLNLEAVDDPRFVNHGWCTNSSAEVCDHLRTQVFATLAGSGRELVDWTALSEDPEMDHAHLYYMGMNSVLVRCLRDTVYYIQRTERNSAFFLTHRELINASCNGYPDSGAGVVPWLAFQVTPGSPQISVPPAAAGNAGELAFIARFFNMIVAPAVECTICLEEFANKYEDQFTACAATESGVLPCAHPICTTCLKNAFSSNTLGMTCPTCKQHFPNFFLQRGKSGRMMIAEKVGPPVL